MDKCQNIKQIYIGNVLESFYKSYTYDKMPKKEADFWRRYDALENNRSLLYGGDNKIVITPEKINSSHLSYICNLAGWKNVDNLIPERQTDCISLDICSDRDFYNKLRKIIVNNPGVEIIQYRHTPEFYLLVEKFREDGLNPVFPELVEKDNKFIEEYFHSKRGFRHLWEQIKDPQLKIDIPEGYITENRKEAIEAGWWFRTKNRDFVLKINRGVQGIGVLMNHCSDFSRDYDLFVKQLGQKLTDGMWEEPIIIVEEYIDPNEDIFGGSPNVEMKIDRQGKILREFSCAQVLDADGKTFLGVVMNREVESSAHIQEAYKAAELFAAKLTEVGYRGVFDMDLVVAKNNKLFAVEANLRRTGGTHAHEFAKCLLGNDYCQYNYVHIQDVSILDNKKREFFKTLEKFVYNKQTKTGIIPVNPDMVEVGKAPILIIAPSKQILNEILEEVNED